MGKKPRGTRKARRAYDQAEARGRQAAMDSLRKDRESRRTSGRRG